MSQVLDCVRTSLYVQCVRLVFFLLSDNIEPSELGGRKKLWSLKLIWILLDPGPLLVLLKGQNVCNWFSQLTSLCLCEEKKCTWCYCDKSCVNIGIDQVQWGFIGFNSKADFIKEFHFFPHCLSPIKWNTTSIAERKTTLWFSVITFFFQSGPQK